MAQQRMKDTSALFDEKEFLKEPRIWPRWPVLPLKLRNGEFSDPKFCGLMHEAYPTRVYFVNMFMLADRARELKAKLWSDILDTIEYKEYPSPSALLADYKID